MMFNESKYTRWYFSIVDNARTRVLDTYTENHHIIPKSMGGSNKKDNIVAITAREHYVCHLLLTKMTVGDNRRKMMYALWIISNRSSKKSSRLYQKTREEVQKIMKNRKHTPESIEKMKQSQALRPSMTDERKAHLSKINTGLVRNFSEEHKAKLSKAGKGREITPEWRAKLSAANKGQGAGRKLSDETKAKLSAARRRTVSRKQSNLPPETQRPATP